ncbi:hypothetical protein GOV14_06010 [Candidatus Pacearchaeota archaeon]|nr:hypothetical protein [Candidatus Pacearchaeota archaeon]
MKRKIIKQGHNTLTITLPSVWTKRFNLEAGKEVDLVERDNGLFVTTEKADEGRKAEFNIENMDIATIWRYFMAAYREGCDEITIHFRPSMTLDNPYKFFAEHKLDLKYGKEREKESPLEFFHSLVNRFIGFEIVDYGRDYVVVKEMSISTSREFDNSLRRVFLLAEQMFEETCEALKINDPKILQHLHDVDINLDKFHDYCVRILNKIGNKESRKMSLLFSTLCFLELIGDEFKNISHHLLYDFPKADFKNIVEIADSIHEQFILYYSLFYKFDTQKVLEISKIDSGRYFNVKKVYKKAKTSEEREIFHHLRVVAKYLNALAELRIEMEF